MLAIASDGAGGVFAISCTGDRMSSRVIWFDPEAEVDAWESFEDFLRYFTGAEME
jgi:hypothetical protein